MHSSILSYAGETSPLFTRLTIDGLERLFGRAELESLYWQVKAATEARQDFFRNALDIASIERVVDQPNVTQRRPDKATLLVANHPYGILDGLALCELAARTSASFKILLHSELCRDPDLDPFFLPVDFGGTKTARKTNIRTKNEALRTLSENGCVAIFPGGGVATRPSFGLGELKEFPWSTFVAKLALQSGADVVPVYFHGENSRLFHFVSGFSQSLRLALLMRELRLRFGTRLNITIGQPFDADAIAAIGTRIEVTHFLEHVVSSLAPSDSTPDLDDLNPVAHSNHSPA